MKNDKIGVDPNDRLYGSNEILSSVTGGDSGACTADRSTVSSDNIAPEIGKGA